MGVGFGVAARRPEMMTAVSHRVAGTRYTKRERVVIMHRQTQRLTYPRNSGNSWREAVAVVASDNSTTGENVDIGDSGERTQDANRFAAVGSA